MTRWAPALALLPAIAGAASQDAPPQQPPVQFESRADLILIDATVVDNSGTPLTGLSAADFVVSVDGTARPITSLQFVGSAPAASVQDTARPRPAHYSTNESAADGRRIMVVVDENSIPPGGARATLLSIERLLKDLSPADRVAFVRLPQFDDSVDFTADRERVLAAVKKTVGKARRLGPNAVTLSEAAAYERRDTFQWQRALTRLCSASTPTPGQSARPPSGGGGVAFDPADEFDFCRQDAENQALDKIMTYQNRARETVDALFRLVSNLRLVPGSKTLVLLSQGFLSYNLRPEITRIADAAAAGRVSLYGLHMDMQGMELDVAEASFTRNEDELLMSDGIDALVGASRGARFRIVGTGQNVFARVARELTGYYLIGLEPTEGDRDGLPHRIKVEVNRPATTVRARAQFTIAAGIMAETPAATPAAQLLELLRAASPEAGVPLRVSAFAMPSSASSRVKVIVGADVGPPAAAPVELHVGYVLVDADGRVAADQFMTVVLRPRGAGELEAPRYVGFAEVPPGEYTIRFAVVDVDGRTGSVHHPVTARLNDVAGVGVSDLILAAPSPGGPVQPEVHVSLQGDQLQALLELAADAARLRDTNVRFEVAETADGVPIVAQRAVLKGGDGPATPAAATLDVGVLPPGDYLARAIVEVPGQKPFARTRPFHVAPRRRVAGRADSEGSPTVAVARPRARPPIPAFRPEDVLAPAVVTPFIDHVLASYSPSRAGRDALNAIKAGDLRNATKGNREMNDVGLAFAQGLSMLSEHRVAEASAYFRAALRTQSEFIGAAFYLGATLAASGKDRDAVGAWQTALIGEVGAAGVYPVLIDGLLRLGEGDEALELLAEAEPTFTERDEYTRRLVQAYALTGRYADALPLAHEYLRTHASDLDMLFLTMHMIFEAQASGELREPAAELERFADYAARYASAQGPQALVVQGWRKAIGIR